MLFEHPRPLFEHRRRLAANLSRPSRLLSCFLTFYFFLGTRFRRCFSSTAPTFRAPKTAAQQTDLGPGDRFAQTHYKTWVTQVLKAACHDLQKGHYLLYYLPPLRASNLTITNDPVFKTWVTQVLLKPSPPHCPLHGAKACAVKAHKTWVTQVF